MATGLVRVDVVAGWSQCIGKVVAGRMSEQRSEEGQQQQQHDSLAKERRVRNPFSIGGPVHNTTDMHKYAFTHTYTRAHMTTGLT